AIDEVIRKHMKDVRACWVDARTRAPDGGTITVKFTIGADGAVTDARIKATTIPDARFQACVVEEFRTFQFPAPEGGGVVIVSYPFVFSP
ncbi:MAG: TonB family protein, partial [Myxococcota bacterium]